MKDFTRILLVPFMLFLSAGCGKKLGDKLESELKTYPGGSQKLLEFAVIPLQEGKEIKTDLLTFTVPEDWEVKEEKGTSEPVTKLSISTGMHRFEGIYIIKVMPGSLWESINEFLAKDVKNPQDFYSSYSSDQQFLEAVYNATPDYVKSAENWENFHKRKALLDLKMEIGRFYSIPLPPKKLSAMNCTALIGAWDRDNNTGALLFDEKKRLRLQIIAKAQKNMTVEEKMNLMARMLINASFP